MTIHNPSDMRAAEIATAAARLDGTPQHLADRLRTLLDAGPPSPPKRSDKGAREAADDHKAAVRAYDDQVAAYRRRLADDFAAIHGWKPTVPLSRRRRWRAARPPGGKWHRGPTSGPTYLPHGDVLPSGRQPRRRGRGASERPSSSRATRSWWRCGPSSRGSPCHVPDFPSWQ